MKKGIIQIFFSNAIFLVVGVLNNFMLPKFLPLETYSQIRTFLLYVSYAGFLNLGYMEGAYLLYGGKTVAETADLNAGNNIKTYYIFQSIIMLLIVSISIIIKNNMIMLFGIGCFTANICNYYKNYCTAVGEYKTYSINTVFDKIGLLCLNVFLLFVLKVDSYTPYCLVIIFISIIQCVFFGFVLQKKEPRIAKGVFSSTEMKTCIGMGVVLLIGNGISNVFVGIDQWFVKFLMSDIAFAVYSFSVSLEKLIALFINPISTVLYNYFCKKKNDDYIVLQDAVALWGVALIGISFVVEFIISNFISNYVDSIELIYVLFSGQALSCIINCFYINLYKAERRQKELMIQMVVMCILAIIFNTVLYLIFKNMISIAVGTLLTKIVWLLICEWRNPKNRYTIKTNIVIVSMIILIIILSLTCKWYIGLIIYYTAFLVLFICLYKRLYTLLLSNISGIIKKFVHNKS